MVVEGDWVPIEKLKSKQIYNILISKRMKLKNDTPSRAHKTISSIHKSLSAEERDYWWRLTHKLISTKKAESKWRRKENGELVDSVCPACGEEEEDREHYEFGCRKGVELRQALARKANRESISREEWQLKKEIMSDELSIMIAKARWLLHKDRCSIDNKQKRKMNITALMDKLNRRLALLKASKKEMGSQLS